MPETTGPSGASTGAGDDKFFILRDGCELFQRRLIEITKRSGVNAPSVIEAFTQEVATAYDELAASAKQDGFEQTHGLTASRIGLVGNDDLELEIRIADLINRLKGNERIDRWRVQLRYMTLLDRPKMPAENNPAGLEPISRGLWAICRTSNASLEQNLDRLDRLEEQLQADLPAVYQELNSFLERRGITPMQVRPLQRAARELPTGASASSANGREAPASAISALEQTVRRRFGEQITPGHAADGGSTEESIARAGSGTGNAVLSASTLTMLNHLMERLDTLERKQSSAQPAAQASLRAIRAGDVDLPLGKPAAIALDTLSLIFDAIFATPDLPDTVKGIIGRLQIPLLKIAILDDRFFSDTQHPARQLINRMAHAAFGLAEDVGREHPVCLQLTAIADAVRAANDGNLQAPLDALDHMITERDQTLDVKSQPYMQLVLAHERRLGAKTHTHDWLQDVLARCTEPSIRHFLSEYWRRVMQTAAESDGPDSARWQESRTAIDDLLWSIQPKQTPEERKRLVAIVPSLIKRLNAELDQLQVSAEERSPFLNACFDLQTAALRQRPDTAARLPVAQPDLAPLASALLPPADGAIPATVEVLEQSGKLVQYLGQPTLPRPAWRTANATARLGDWIAFELPDEERLCGRHCGEAQGSGSVLLFNPDWGYAVALSRVHLERQLADGKAHRVSATSLFDQAAEHALARIAPH